MRPPVLIDVAPGQAVRVTDDDMDTHTVVIVDVYPQIATFRGPDGMLRSVPRSGRQSPINGWTLCRR